MHVLHAWRIRLWLGGNINHPILQSQAVGHEGRQAFSVLISVVTQRGAFVLGIASGCL